MRRGSRVSKVENRAYALWVGVFTLALGALVMAAFWWFSSGGQNTTEYLIVSPRSVSGLNPQAAVRFRGVRVGKVTAVDLLDSREVHIRIQVEADVPVTRATRAKVGIQGLTGQGFVQLDDDGSNPLPPLGQAGSPPVIAMQPGLLDQATEAGQDILARLKTSSERVERILSEDNLARIDATLKSLSASAAHLEKTLAQTQALAADMRRFTAPENAERLANTLKQLQQVSTQLSPAVEDFRKALAKVDAAGTRIDRLGADVQTSLAGETLPRVNQLMQDLQANSQQINRVLDEIERAPQSLLLGKGARQPGPGETLPGAQP